jgi:NAD(P)-dependent dehydrogenase (short-subunit alcohol dehydrogenase family)
MEDSVALVTGAAGDIGQAITTALARSHATVVLADLDLAGAEGAASALQSGCAGRLVAMRADVTDPSSLAGLAQDVAVLGPLRTLVSNAGAARAASLGSTATEDWNADRALNLDAHFHLFHAFAPALVAARGSLVTIASVNALGVFGHPAYSAAKAGLVHLTRQIAVEYGRKGVRANVVAPGTVRTRAWAARAAANPGVFAEAAAHYPLGRIARPEDVADAVAFLASAAAITGICLPVDCGLTAGIPALARTFSQSDDY